MVGRCDFESRGTRAWALLERFWFWFFGFLDFGFFPTTDSTTWWRDGWIERDGWETDNQGLCVFRVRRRVEDVGEATRVSHEARDGE